MEEKSSKSAQFTNLNRECREQERITGLTGLTELMGLDQQPFEAMEGPRTKA